MSAVANVMDSVMSMGCVNKDHEKEQQSRYSLTMLAAYIVFFMTSVAVVHAFDAGQFSVLLTLSSGVQCLGFFLLSMKVKQQKTVAGLSSRTLEMYIIFFFLRLASTLFKNGYLPVDRTGDHVYQIADIGSLVIVLSLVYSMHRTHKDTYQAEQDTLPIYNMVPGCLLLALCLHGNLHGNRFWDVLWCMSLMMDTITMLPQLWMLTKLGGRVESLTSHFVASMVVSRCLALTFWTRGYLALEPKDGSANTGGWVILGAYCIQLLLCADFMYYYVKARWTTGMKTGVMLPAFTEV